MNIDEINNKYIKFASKISFFEFGTQDEFRPAFVDVNALSKAIEELQGKNNWNIGDLSDYITKLPESFKLFENLFRLDRFSNTQLIHFLFDTAKLNSNNLNAVYEYVILNLKFDRSIRDVFLNFVSKELNQQISYDDIVFDTGKISKEALVAYFKMVVNIYAIKADKNIDYVENRLRKNEFSDSAIRIANYVLNTLQLNNFLKTVKVKDYLQIKLVPNDTKSIHGNFLKNKLTNMLDKASIENIDGELKNRGINKLPQDLSELNLKVEIGYCTEKYVEGINKASNGKMKKFDIIIIVKNKPKHLFEVNFYTTEGTKIGINEGEYVELNESITKIGLNNFHWITDGNYWLTKQGKERYINLLGRFSEIYNANMFEENIANFTR
ncbi:MAG: DpnII family type II restriction endonuclease [Candidatus Parvarchaeum sp.]